MTIFEKYARIFALSTLFAASNALPYIHFKFYDIIRAATQTTNTELGYLMTVFIVVSILIYLPAGIIGDRWSTRKILICSASITSLCNVVFAIIPSFASALVIWGVLAVSACGVYPCLIKAVRVSGDKEEQGRMFGTFLGMQGFVMVVIGFIDAYIYEMFTDQMDGLKYMLFFQAAALVIAVICVCLFITDKTPYDFYEDQDEKSASAVNTLLEVLKSGRVWILVVLITCSYGCYVSMGYMTPYTTNVLGASITFGAVLGTVRVYGIRIFAGPISGYIADKLGNSSRLMIIAYSIFIGLILYLLNMSPATSHTVIIAITMLISFACMMFYCVMYASMEEVRIPPHQTATAVSVITIFSSLPDAVFGLLYGHWLDVQGPVQGYVTIFNFIAVLACIGLLAVITVNAVGKKQITAE
ncbi:MFS transporter [Taurinivorans muris]|uniref:MFS transporter n=1 Tax=Taurinivorans muris TaxID=2787751 RepID=A0ABY5Y149_9BACT|nr:MFS transporter [Desulfovibrionaceae bacterium LT0009]